MTGFRSAEVRRNDLGGRSYRWVAGRGRNKSAKEGRRVSFFFKTGTLLATNDSSVQVSAGKFPKKLGTLLATKVSSVQGCLESLRISCKKSEKLSSICRKDINSNP